MKRWSITAKCQSILWSRSCWASFAVIFSPCTHFIRLEELIPHTYLSFTWQTFSIISISGFPKVPNKLFVFSAVFICKMCRMWTYSLGINFCSNFYYQILSVYTHFMCSEKLILHTYLSFTWQTFPITGISDLQKSEISRSCFLTCSVHK